MSDYTPTTEEVRGRHNANAVLDQRTWRMADAEFNRWLAAHDAEVLAAAGVTQPEPEYEYRLALIVTPRRGTAFTQATTGWYPTVDEACETRKAREWIYYYRREYPGHKLTQCVQRRVVAGEPEPVPNQTGETP